MKKEGFPLHDPEKDQKVIESIIKGDFEKFGRIVKGKSRDQVLEEDFERYSNISEGDEEGAISNDTEEEEESEKRAEEWKNSYEKGMFQVLYPSDPSIVLYEILTNNYPELGIEIRDKVVDNLGLPLDGVKSVYIEDQQSREVVSNIIDNPIIELLLCPTDHKKTFEEIFKRVSRNNLLQSEYLERIKARFLYFHYKFLRENKAPDDELISVEKEISNIQPRALTDAELIGLFENIIKEELGK